MGPASRHQTSHNQLHCGQFPRLRGSLEKTQRCQVRRVLTEDRIDPGQASDAGATARQVDNFCGNVCGKGII